MRVFKNEDGFTLIEAIVALAIAVVLFTVLGATLAATMNTQRQARIQQEATALANQYVELSRAMRWNELAMDVEESGDPRTGGSALLGSAAGLPANEALVVDGSNGLIDSKVTETIDDTTFTIWQYVTEINSELRRVVVFVDWDENDSTRSHHLSTVIAENRKWSFTS